MELRSGLNLRGDITIELIDANGAVRTRMDIRNTIVYVGQNAVLSLLAQNAGIVPTDYKLTRLIPGTGTVAPTFGDTGPGVALGLSDQIVLTDSDRSLNPATRELVITGVLSAAQGNGNTISEINLMTGNGGLFARQIFPGFPKTNAFSVRFTWRIGATAISS